MEGLEVSAARFWKISIGEFGKIFTEKVFRLYKTCSARSEMRCELLDGVIVVFEWEIVRYFVGEFYKISTGTFSAIL